MADKKKKLAFAGDVTKLLTALKGVYDSLKTADLWHGYQYLTDAITQITEGLYGPPALAKAAASFSEDEVKAALANHIKSLEEYGCLCPDTCSEFGCEGEPAGLAIPWAALMPLMLQLLQLFLAKAKAQHEELTEELKAAKK